MSETEDIAMEEAVSVQPKQAEEAISVRDLALIKEKVNVFDIREVGVLMWGEVHSVNDVTNEFVVDLMIFTMWHEAEIKIEGAPNQSVPVHLDALPWRPDIHPLSANEFKNEILTLHVNAKTGDCFAMHNWIVNVREPLELQRFPWDRQCLNMGIHGVNCKFGVYKLGQNANPPGFPHPSKLKDGARISSSLTNFKLVKCSPIIYAGGQNIFIQARIERWPHYYMWNVVFVLFLLVLVSSFSAFLPITDAAGRQGVSATFVLAGVAYKYVISQMLPPVAYQTRLDFYVLFALFMLSLNMVESLVATVLLDQSEILLAKDVDFIFFFSFVGLWLLVHLIIMIMWCAGICYMSWDRVLREDNQSIQESGL